MRINSPSECAPYLDKRVPVVFAGAVDQWPARHRWTPEYIARQCPETVRVYEFTRRDSLETGLDDFVTYLRTGERSGMLADTDDDLYLAWDSTVLGANLALQSDFDFTPFWGSRLGIAHTGFWMGGDGAHTPLHTDIDATNLHAVLYGKKRFLLFAPETTDCLYPSDVYEWATVFSAVDFRTPDIERFPKLAEAAGVEAVLEPGDLLYIPVGWWHAVTCLEPTVSLNAWLFSPALIFSANLYRDLARRALHAVGLHGRDRCTCHGHGDLRRHLGWA